MVCPQRALHRATPGILVFALACGHFSGLATRRSEAVQTGPNTTASAVYRLDEQAERPGEPASLLGSVSDAALRVTALGRLERADAIAVLVPGVGHKPAEFDLDEAPGNGAAGEVNSLPARARALFDTGAKLTGAPARLAVVAWLGYTPPSAVVGALGHGPIGPGATNLAAFQQELTRLRPDVRVTWICHSYGTLVCASALVEADPDAVVLLASPGLPHGSVADLPTDAVIWAGRGDADPIRFAAGLDLFSGGFGTDPAAASFGARRLPTDPGTGHSGYFSPGSTALTAIARAALGLPVTLPPTPSSAVRS